MLGNSTYYGLIEDFISSSTAAVCKLSKLEKMAPHITIIYCLILSPQEIINILLSKIVDKCIFMNISGKLYIADIPKYFPWI